VSAGAKNQTICKDCVFADFNQDDVQTGCQFGRLPRFEKNGAVITQEEADFVTYFRVSRFCTAVRTQEWADRQSDQTPAGLRIAAYEEFKLRPLAVVYVDSSHSDEDVERSIASLASQDLPPAHLTVCYRGQFGRAESRAMRFGMEPPPFSWNVIQGEEATPEQHEQYDGDDYRRLIDEAVYPTSLLHYTAAKAGFVWPEGFFDKLDYAKNIDLKQIVGVYPKADRPGEGFLSLVPFHRQAGENRFKPLWEKFAEVSGEESNTTCFVPFEDFA
jgi:hypothetical protein